MRLYRFLLGVDLFAAAVVLFFFCWGLTDGTVSSFNIGIWSALIGGVALVLVSGLTLNARGMRRLANAALAILAVPALAVGGFFALTILTMAITGARWN